MLLGAISECSDAFLREGADGPGGVRSSRVRSGCVRPGHARSGRVVRPVLRPVPPKGTSEDPPSEASTLDAADLRPDSRGGGPGPRTATTPSIAKSVHESPEWLDHDRKQP